VTPEAYRSALTALDLSQARLARLLKVDKTTANRWAQGHTTIPGGTSLLLWCVTNGRVTIDELESVE